MTWKTIWAFIKFLPEFIRLANRLAAAFEEGVTVIKLKGKFKDIDEAFENPDAQSSAGDLDSVFTDRV